MSKSIVRLIWSLLIVAIVGLSSLSARAQESADPRPSHVELLNVSSDATRELFEDLNKRFSTQYEKDARVKVTIKQSHAGSGRQSQAVLQGQLADVVTLALWPDTDALRGKGLIAEGWERRLPNRSLPYTSTIVFVVRKDNPKNIRDWSDLTRDGVKVVTPNPQTSGNGQLTFLAAWGSVLRRGGNETEARTFVTRLYKHVPILDDGARESADTFAVRGIGDVHVTWESEAHREVRASKGALQIVYPPVSIQAEPHVAVVDEHVDRRKTRAAAEAYLRYLYTDDAQEVIAQHFYRPIRPAVLKRYAETFPVIELFTIQELARDWNDARQRFFAQGGIFDTIANSRRN